MELSKTKIQILKKLNIYGWKVSKIIKDLKITPKNVYEHINQLIEKGYYEKGKGVTELGKKSMGYQSKAKWRLHGLQIFLDLPIDMNKEKWKANRNRVLSLKKISHDNIILRNKSGITDQAPRFYIDSYDIRFHSNGIMAYIPEINGYSKFEVEAKLIENIKTIRLRVNDILKANFNSARIVRYELAKVDDGMAKSLRLNEKKVYTLVDGQLRMVFDFSLAKDERESHNASFSLADHTKMDTVVKDYIENKAYSPQDTSKFIDALLQQNTFISNQQALLAKQIEAHLSVVNEMKSLASETKELINRLNIIYGEKK